MNNGMSFAAIIEMTTSIAACLKPLDIDSSLILPATIPIRQLWNITDVMKMVFIMVKSLVGRAAPGTEAVSVPVVNPIIIMVVATSKIEAR